jgi:UDP-glucose 4-epimerase
MFKNKILLITGGTGSFGNAVLERFLDSDLAEIRIFSRDEKKQDDMRKTFMNSKVKFYLGDVRDYDSTYSAMKNVDFVFHAAALKQVPSCEFYPLEAVKTNVIGTENVLNAAIASGVQRVICLSTDKAVYPINSMGISKAMMEKVALAKSRDSFVTTICITRYGNVMCSRGSVIPLFVSQILNNQPLTITDPEMTRFMMTLDNAVDLVMYAFKNGESGDIFVQKSPACSVEVLVETIRKYFKRTDHPIDIIGTRHGEKLFEVLMSREETHKAIDLGSYFRVPPDDRDLNYENYIQDGDLSKSKALDYNSDNTNQLSSSELMKLLKNLKIESLQV